MTIVNGTVGADSLFGKDAVTELFTSGLRRPVFLTSPSQDTDRLFVPEGHTGQVRIVDAHTGTIAPTPFLALDGLTTGAEQGLLGLAFHPDYADNGLFYVNYTNAAGDTVVVQYQSFASDPNRADPASATTVITVEQPFANHNGGWLAFGPDGFLYIGSGDGGSAGDPGNRAQDITDQLLGKILRIDVNGDDFPSDPFRNYLVPSGNPFVDKEGDDEIWAYGLRNPWRASFDRLTGDLYIGDVGQNAREEIDFQPAGAGGRNYGWKVMEGSRIFNASVPGNPSPSDPSLILPIHEYGHTGAPNGGNSVTGGYVYRGPIQSLAGGYFFADFVSGQVWSFRYDGSQKLQFVNRTGELAPSSGTLNQIASFGEDQAGNLYLVGLDGEIFKLVPSHDTMSGHEGSDRMFGRAGNDTLLGESGEDTLDGNEGDDVLDGGSERDRVYGSAGEDQLLGADDQDFLHGGDGHDTVAGGRGDDILQGHAGNDQLDGGEGADTIDGGNGQDVSFGGDDSDQIYGGDGDDSLTGSGGADKMDAGDGKDSLAGGTEADVLLGGEGTDSLLGGEDNDRLWGGSAGDFLSGNTGGDRLSGGDGDDTILGGLGPDVLLGETGADIFVFAAGDGGNSIAAADRIFDFENGTDKIGLADSLRVEDLSISQGVNRVGGGASAPDSVVTVTTSGEILFVLQNTTGLEATDFIEL